MVNHTDGGLTSYSPDVFVIGSEKDSHVYSLHQNMRLDVIPNPPRYVCNISSSCKLQKYDTSLYMICFSGWCFITNTLPLPPIGLVSIISSTLKVDVLRVKQSHMCVLMLIKQGHFESFVILTKPLNKKNMVC